MNIVPVATNDAGFDSHVDAEPDGSQTPSPEESRQAPEPIHNWHVLVCERASGPHPGESATLGIGSLVGDDRKELIINCGGETHLLGFADSDPVRVARFGNGETTAIPSRPSVADVSGDGRSDLILGHARIDESGSPIGGALYVVSTNEQGGLNPPRLLGSISVTSIVSGDFDDHPGADIAVVHWPDGHGLRPSELWLFRGGPSPTRYARSTLGQDGRDVAVVDFDQQPPLDFATVDHNALRIFSTNGQAGPTLEIPSAKSAVAADIDGNGTFEVVMVGETLHLVQFGEEIHQTPIESPFGVRRIVLDDVDGDGDLDIFAITREHIVLLRQKETLQFEQEPWISLPGTLRPHDALIRHIGAEREMIIVASSVRGWELIATPLVRTEISAVEAPPLKNAPLMLRFP